MINKTLLALLAALTLGCYSLSAQPLFSIDGQPVMADEFKAIYQKNTNEQGLKETIDDYLKLYITFKLKVHEAKMLKLDTAQAFRIEYAGYAKQLAQPYMSDVSVNQALIDEAYDRMCKEVNASHILINIGANGDTVRPYQQAMEARRRILSGEAFEKVALETSNDPSVSRNSGRLGYFSAFQMVYPFECAAYNTPVGQVSMPVRTQFGYHLVKVHDVRPTRGRVKTAHIMIKAPQNATPQAIEAARRRIVDIHEQLLSGADFAELARTVSEDEGTAKNGGEFPWISSGQIIPQIEQVAFALPSPGSISGPFQTPFGWHVLKLIDRQVPGSKAAETPEIKAKIARDSRARKSHDSFIAKLKNQYNFSERKPLNLSDLRVDTSIFKGTWTPPQYTANPTLFKLDNRDYTLAQLAAYIAKHQANGQRNISVKRFVRESYQNWTNQEIMAYEEQHLEEKYPAYKHLAREYYEGMLLFEVSNLMVWARSNDSTLLANFYQRNSNRYTWGERTHYATYTLADASKAPKMRKLLSAKKSTQRKPSDIAAEAQRKFKTTCTHTQGAIAPNAPELAEARANATGIAETTNPDGSITFTHILRTTNGDVKTLTECRGELTADLQQELEEQWLAQLRQKYSVEINQQTLQTIKAELK